jgi:16S rRNA (uracil1498-N3)-methyltransferase
VTPRLFCPPPLAAGAETALPSAAAHHATRVLRLKRGDAVTLFDGEGASFRPRLHAWTRTP